MKDGDILWTARPSSLLLLGSAVWLSLIAAAIGFGLHKIGLEWVFVYTPPLVIWLLFILPAWLQLRFMRYTLSDKTLYVQKGILNRQTDPIDLFRVLDVTSDEPLWLRPWSLGSIMVYSADVTSPKQRVIGIKNPQALKDELRRLASQARTERGVREFSAQPNPQ